VAHIEVRNAVVEFPIYNSKSRSLQLWLYQSLGGSLNEQDRHVVVRALDGVSLTIREGERVGIIGHNGAGKTTLLRLLSRIYAPSAGIAKITGGISSLTDMTMGMDGEATGYDNILFRSVFMGMSFKEARERMPEIAAFSELGNYLELPVRTYSTGMFLRLAFAISTSVFPDILILDEMLSAGDESFRMRAQARINELLQRSKILVLSSHDLGSIRSLCQRVIWMEHGKIKMEGAVEDILGEYKMAA
jgi:ABC-type polysaccharide/polyol phosphate transport system ATPase subunit